VTTKVGTAARQALHAAKVPLATARLRKAIRTMARPIALELGARGARPGWLVTDTGGATPHHLDPGGRWPFEDGALSFVYADNVIEDLPLAQGRALLAEARRCLRPGGTLRLATPDIARHVELYLVGAPAISSAVASGYRSAGVAVEYPIDLVRAPIGGFGHHDGYVYDFEALADELQRAGFERVVQEPMGESDHPQLVGLERRSEPGADAQLVVEATR
jgi:SAM-dependent methyltransferase